MTHVETFTAVYIRELARVVEERPDEYPWARAGKSVDSVAAKMVPAFKAGEANKDGLACKRTCKALGIPYTYAGIKAYLNEEVGGLL